MSERVTERIERPRMEGVSGLTRSPQERQQQERQSHKDPHAQPRISLAQALQRLIQAARDAGQEVNYVHDPVDDMVAVVMRENGIDRIVRKMPIEEALDLAEGAAGILLGIKA